MSETWKSAYRRIGHATPHPPVGPSPYQQALRDYLALRSRAQKSLLILGSSGLSAFFLVCIVIGRLSLRVLPPPLPPPAEVVLTPAAPDSGLATDPAKLEALASENIQLQLEVHHRMEAVERAYALAVDWSVRARHADRATRPPPPAELLQAVGLEVGEDFEITTRPQP